MEIGDKKALMDTIESTKKEYANLSTGQIE